MFDFSPLIAFVAGATVGFICAWLIDSSFPDSDHDNNDGGIKIVR